MKSLAIIVAIYGLLTALVYAQSVGGMSGIAILNSGSSGGGGGGGGTSCANTLVLDYSDSCHLMAQAWGE